MGRKKDKEAGLSLWMGMSSWIKKSEEEEVKEGMKDSQFKISLQLRFSARYLDGARLAS